MSAPNGSSPPDPKLLAAYFDGECEGRDDLSQLRQVIESWLAADRAAQKDHSEHRRLLKAWRSTTPAEPDPAQWSAMLRRIREKAQEKSGRGRRTGRSRVFIGWSLAACVVAASIVLVLFFQPSPRTGLLQTPVVSAAPAAIDDEVLPVADAQEVVIVRVEGADTQTLVVGQLPVQGVLELAAPGDVVLMRVSPDASDSMVPHMNESRTPLIWSKLDSELD